MVTCPDGGPLQPEYHPLVLHPLCGLCSFLSTQHAHVFLRQLHGNTSSFSLFELNFVPGPFSLDVSDAFTLSSLCPLLSCRVRYSLLSKHTTGGRWDVEARVSVGGSKSKCHLRSSASCPMVHDLSFPMTKKEVTREDAQKALTKKTVSCLHPHPPNNGTRSQLKLCGRTWCFYSAS